MPSATWFVKRTLMLSTIRIEPTAIAMSGGSQSLNAVNTVCLLGPSVRMFTTPTAECAESPIP
jgi:hypothetical protein